MLETRDWFFLILSFCAVWFTVFLCWILYQIVVLLRNINTAVKDVKAPIEKAINYVKSKSGF